MIARPALLAASALLFGTTLTACGSDTANAGADSDGKLAVAANFYPIAFLADSIGGDRVDVTDLTPAGTEPHDLALDGPSRAALQDASVVLYLGADFQPDVQDAVADLPDDVEAVDLLQADGVTLRDAPADLGKESLSGNKDPHVWLDPVEMRAMAAAVEKAFSTADPDHADTYAANLASLDTRLGDLDSAYSSGLANCAQDTIVTSHAAFGYLAARYGLTQIAIAGISPDDEPDPATFAKITDVARKAGVGTVFFEEALPPDLADTVAREIGARTDLLAALEFEPESGQDYVSVMQANLQRLEKGLDCS